MSRGTLIGLLIAAVIALAGGWYFGTATEPVERTTIDAGKLMFPDLTANLKNARRIEITSKGKVTVIELKNGVWGIADRAGYPVQESKLRGMLTALTELRMVEPRTADPSEYSRLGLEDPVTDKTGSADLLRVLDGDGKPIVSVIVGHRRMRTQGDVPEQVYVRLPGARQTWLAEPGLQADADPQVWLDRDIMNISHELITKVVATKDGATVELTRDGDKMKVTKPADYPKLEDYKVDDVGRALESLTFEDVKSDKEPIGDMAGQSVFTTTDGLEIGVTIYHLGKDSWTRFTVTSSDRAKPEAARLNAKFAGWAFETGTWKDKALVPSIDDLKAPPPEPAKAEEPQTMPPSPAVEAPQSTAPAAAATPLTPPGKAPAPPAATAPQAPSPAKAEAPKP